MNIFMWSGGKDSTAQILLARKLGIPIDLILMSVVWFDKKREISAENPEHMKWVTEYAVPLLRSWGYPVEFVSSDRDYIYWFYKVRQKSKMHPDHVGKHYGYVIGLNCKMQGEKSIPMQKRSKELRKHDFTTEFVGICADEPPRIERMEKRGQRSLLVENGITQADAYAICKENSLLSPAYGGTMGRGGCWFCPNQSIDELARLKTGHPELWQELVTLSKVENTVAKGFKYGVSFDEIEKKVDLRIRYPKMEQMNLFD